MLNFNASLDWSEHFSLGVFAQNLLNDRGYLDPLSIEETAARARPRTYGIQFGATF
jgi:outer membrane receptor protein involved in Fe transport